MSLILRGVEEFRVGAETRLRVLQAARELGYTVNPAARRLAGGRNRILGIFTYEALFPISYDDWLHPFLVGIEEEAEATGHDLLLFTSAVQTPRRTRSVYVDGENKLGLADGAILLGREGTTADLGRLLDEHYPFVFIGRRQAADGRPVAFAAPDYRTASLDVIRRLTALGHRRFLFVGSSAGLPSNEDRLAGLREGLDDVGSALELSWMPVEEIGQRLPDDAGQRGITAILAENNEYASVIADAMDAAGRPCPQSYTLAVLGAAHVGTRFSGFAVAGEEVGRVAVKLLASILDGGTADSQLVPCIPLLGATAGPIPGHAGQHTNE